MDVLDILNLAIEREERAQLVYSDAADRSASNEGKRVFAWLASEELGHARLLQQQKTAIEQTGAWLPEEQWASSGEVSRPLDRAELPPPSEVVGELAVSDTELNILRQAAVAERDAAAFYADAAEQTADASGKALLSQLAAVERGHQALLEEEHEWLNRSKTMFTIHRFPPLPP